MESAPLRRLEPNGTVLAMTACFEASGQSPPSVARTGLTSRVMAWVLGFMVVALLIAMGLGPSAARTLPPLPDSCPVAPYATAVQEWRSMRLPDVALGETLDDRDQDESRDSAGLSTVFFPRLMPPGSEAYASLEESGPLEWSAEPEAPPPRTN